MSPFDLLGPLPQTGSTTVLEASAGTGKTFALAALVTRYVAEGEATLDEMLLITFGRAASRELRERVRRQLVEASAHLSAVLDGSQSVAGDNELLTHLAAAPRTELARRSERLRDALAGFDAATIATTHQFCQIVLRSLGVAGDSEAGVTLVESLDDLVSEVVDDLYLQRFGQAAEPPRLTHADALALSREAVANPHTELRPAAAAPGSVAAVRVDFARAVLAELEHRKRRTGVLGYDDLLGRLADALLPVRLADGSTQEAPARIRMGRRWRIVMVDEFQDTDPVQWQVIDRAFRGQATVVLIGDPKQAIYAFRGGDVATYLVAAATAGDRRTLGTNWRSDAPLVDALQTVLRGAALGHPDIVVREVEARHRTGRLAGAPHPAPFRLRVATRDVFGAGASRTVAIDKVRDFVAADLAADVAGLLASGATYDGRPVGAGDVAVIVESHKDARVCQQALVDAGVPVVYTGDTDVFASPAAADWLCLLEAMAAPQRSGLVRAAALTPFFGESAAGLADGGDEVTDRVAQTVREWADHARLRGLAAVLEQAQLAGLGRRVLSHARGERRLTDLSHVAELLHERSHRERLGLPALLEWLREQHTGRAARERNRRLDSDATAVQIMTVWVSKGLQFPLVYLPFAFNRYVPAKDLVLFHDDGRRCLDLGGKQAAGFDRVDRLGREEMAGDDIRLTYVALTRAQSQVVAWWAPTYDEPNGGLSRLLRGRSPGQAAVPDRCPAQVTDVEAVGCFRAWEAAGGPVVERAAIADLPPRATGQPPGGLSVRRFTRSVDVEWRRTSYSGLIRSAADTVGVTSEPEVVPLDDEATLASDADPADPLGLDPDASSGDPAAVRSPMSDLPSGAAFGSLVHAVLEHVDPQAPDLRAELLTRVREQATWWPVGTPAETLADALVPLHHTPLGPLAGGLTLADLGMRDRLCELDFEIPLTGGDRPTTAGATVTLADVGTLLRAHLAADDPLLPYAGRLAAPGLGGQTLRGYLSGSIDVVLRVPGEGADPAYLVVDYKTNRLGEPDRPVTAADYAPDRLTEAMLHSDYPLQALIYVVVLHRYLRWRQPGYDPGRHLGGVLYLYLRGMCGPETPLTDGRPAGVFAWRPPVALVTALSGLLDGRRP